MPLERLRAQLFLAGEAEWRDALDAPGLATFAEALLDAHGSLAARFETSERPASVIADVVAGARRDLFEEQYSPALSIAERALRAVLVRTAQGETSVADAAGADAAAAWQRNRGDAHSLLRGYVAELFGQWAGHVASRDTARLVDLEGQRTTRTVQALAAELARESANLAGSVRLPDVDAATVGDQWQEIVAKVFQEGRRLKPHDGS